MGDLNVPRTKGPSVAATQSKPVAKVDVASTHIDPDSLKLETASATPIAIHQQIRKLEKLKQDFESNTGIGMWIGLPACGMTLMSLSVEAAKGVMSFGTIGLAVAGLAGFAYFGYNSFQAYKVSLEIAKLDRSLPQG